MEIAFPDFLPGQVAPHEAGLALRPRLTAFNVIEDDFDVAVEDCPPQDEPVDFSIKKQHDASDFCASSFTSSRGLRFAR